MKKNTAAIALMALGICASPLLTSASPDHSAAPSPSASEETAAVQASSESEAESAEEKKALMDQIAELEKQLKELSETKFLNGTIGGLASGALTAVLYVIMKIAGRKDIKKQSDFLARGNSLIDNVTVKVSDLSAQNLITKQQYETATKALNETKAMLDKANGKYEETERQLKAVQSQYLNIVDEFNKVMESIKELAKCSSDAVKSGAYGKIVEIQAKASDIALKAIDSAEGTAHDKIDETSDKAREVVK